MAGNFWPREISFSKFPPIYRQYQVEDETAIVVLEHHPLLEPTGQIICVHGLEGSADAGYIRSLTQAALLRGFGVHRTNLRTCGGTEELCQTMYHSGLTADTRAIVEQVARRQLGPVFLVGFSLGGNIVLKLAAELKETRLVAGVCAVSTPIDLAECVQQIDKRSNWIYNRRFVRRLCDRIRRKSESSNTYHNTDDLDRIETIWEFDDRFTAPLFGFGTAANYYATQSASRFLNAIRIPTLVVTAKDDPLVPFRIYEHPAFQSNPALQLLATEHGGHLGFLSRKKPRFWLDGVLLDWMEGITSETSDASCGTHSRHLTYL